MEHCPMMEAANYPAPLMTWSIPNMNIYVCTGSESQKSLLETTV